MSFRSLTPFEYAQAQSLDASAQTIRGQAKQTISEISMHFGDKQGGQSEKLKFVVSDVGDRCLAEVQSAFGKGRFRLEWKFDAGGLVGILILERERFDQYEVQFWEPVLRSETASYNGWSGSFADVVGKDGRDDKVMNVGYARGMAVLYAIAGGPIRDLG